MNWLQIVGSSLSIIGCAESPLKSKMKVLKNPIESKMKYYRRTAKRAPDLPSVQDYLHGCSDYHRPL